MSELEVYEVFAVLYAQRMGTRGGMFIHGDPHDAPMPMDYFNSEGNFISPAFLEYIQPLIGELPDFIELEKLCVPVSRALLLT